MASKRTFGTAALRYATALVDVAREGENLPAIGKDIQTISAMIAASDDFRAFIRSPLFRRGDQEKALAAIAKKAGLHQTTLNFLMVLVKNRRLGDLETIVQAFNAEYARQRNETPAAVVSAHALSAAQSKDLKGALEQALGHPVTLDASVDPGLLGGIRVTIGSLMIDDTVKRKLERLKRVLQSPSNQNIVDQKEAS